EINVPDGGKIGKVRHEILACGTEHGQKRGARGVVAGPQCGKGGKRAGDHLVVALSCDEGAHALGVVEAGKHARHFALEGDNASGAVLALGAVEEAFVIVGEVDQGEGRGVGVGRGAG